MHLESIIVDLSKNPFSPVLNFEAAKEYKKQNQLASAVSFFLRTIEFGHESESLLVYISLIELAKCFDAQNDRVHTVSNALEQAIAYLPTRPEAYFFLSNFYERLGNWQKAYTFAEIGLSFADCDYDLPIEGYHGSYCLEFEKAVAGYWIGRKDESIKLFKQLEKQDLAPEYRRSVRENLLRLE